MYLQILIWKTESFGKSNKIESDYEWKKQYSIIKNVIEYQEKQQPVHGSNSSIHLENYPNVLLI
jgi:hypothetical protein